MVSVKLFFGISYLSLPNTFAQCGLLGGIILFTTVIILNAITMLQILKVAAYFRDVKSYSDLGERVFGRRGRLIGDVCILVKQIGTCVTYLYFVSTQLDFIICQYSGRCIGSRLYMLILVIPVIVMSSIGSYKFLSYLSIPSVLIAITGMLCIFYYSFMQMAPGSTSSEELLIFDFWKMMGRIGLAMYLFDGTAIVINVRSEAGSKSNRYPSILMKAVAFDLILFVCFAIICYSVYREQTKPIFTMSLVPINSMVIFIFTCVCINALTSYPVQILAAFSIIERFTISQEDSYKIAVVKRVTLRALIIIMTTLVCMVVKTFTDFINIAGALGSVTVAFILP
jgi:amino acid permease